MKFQITITSSEAYSMVNSLDKLQAVNGSSDVFSSESEHKIKVNHGVGNATTILDMPQKTSFKCKGKPKRACKSETGRKSGIANIESRSNSTEKVAFQSGRIEKGSSSGLKKRKLSKSNNHKRKFSDSRSISKSSKSTVSNSDYLPVKYGPYGYQDEVPEARSWITVPLFIIFSIIQFKLVAAIFLAFFGPMILFLLVVQGFLFKATIVLLGLMMS